MKREIVNSGRAKGEEEQAYEEACGDSILNKSIPGIPHPDYRVLIMKEALKKASQPTTKDFALAKIKVDNALENKGIGIIIPGARPSRRTV